MNCTIKFSDAGFLLSTKRKIRKYVDRQGASVSDYVQADVSNNTLTVRDLDRQMIDDALKGLPSNDYEINEIQPVEKTSTPDLSGAGPSLGKQLQAAYDVVIDELEGKIGTLQVEVDQVYGAWEESNALTESLTQENQNLESRLNLLKEETSTATPLEAGKKLLSSLREDYQSLADLGLTGEEFSDLREVKSLQEYMERRTGKSIPYSLKELTELPDRFEDTKEYKQFDQVELTKAQEVLSFVKQIGDTPIPASVLSAQAIEDSQGLVDSYAAETAAYEEKKTLQGEIGGIKDTYEAFKTLAQKVNYRENKSQSIGCLCTDSVNNNGKLVVSIVSGLEKGQDDQFSQELTSYIARALGIKAADEEGHISCSDGRKVISREYRSEHRFDVITGIQKLLQQDKEKYTFSHLGVGMELTHRSTV